MCVCVYVCISMFKCVYMYHRYVHDTYIKLNMTHHKNPCLQKCYFLG